MTISFPEWVVPMAATLTQDRFTGPEWIFERKFDGIRLLAFKQGPDVRLLSRNRLPQNIPSVVQAMVNLPVQEVIFDGEVTWNRGGVVYHVFDILWFDGRDVTSQPLGERRTLLSELPLTAPLQRVASLDDPTPWELARNEGWEGVIAKRRDSRYEHRRSPHWLKMKCEATEDLVVGGFTDPQGKRVGLGALLVGLFKGDDFLYAGKVGTGFDTKLLLDLRARLDTLEIAKPPFTKAGQGAHGAPARERRGVSGPRPSTSSGRPEPVEGRKRPSRGSGQSPELRGLPRLRAHWVRPEIVVQVAFIEWTAHGKLRHPRLLGVKP